MRNGWERRLKLARYKALGFSLLAIAASLSTQANQRPAEAANYIATLPPGASLPSSKACRDKVLATTNAWEPRPENRTANNTTGGSVRVRIDGASSAYNAKYAGRVRGNFTGTTHQILRWAACKWGLDEDITKARTVAESYWRQSQLGDQETSSSTCNLIGKSAPCWTSYGVLQVKGTVHEGTYPTAQRSTSFNADYASAWQRACFDGDFTWLRNGYRAGDVWGCVGAWYSGNWYDAGAVSYIARVKDHLAKQVWEQPGF
jgi:autotransporter family porin